MTPQAKSAWIGILLSLPFFIMNAIVAIRPEPVYSFLRSIHVLSASPIPLVPILVLLGLLGSYIAARPLAARSKNERFTPYIANVIIALTLFSFFVFVGIVLGEEVYQCEILQVLQCD